jgi:hypothetical protein
VRGADRGPNYREECCDHLVGSRRDHGGSKPRSSASRRPASGPIGRPSGVGQGPEDVIHRRSSRGAQLVETVPALELLGAHSAPKAFAHGPSERPKPTPSAIRRSGRAGASGPKPKGPVILGYPSRPLPWPVVNLPYRTRGIARRLGHHGPARGTVWKKVISSRKIPGHGLHPGTSGVGRHFVTGVKIVWKIFSRKNFGSWVRARGARLPTPPGVAFSTWVDHSLEPRGAPLPSLLLASALPQKRRFNRLPRHV